MQSRRVPATLALLALIVPTTQSQKAPFDAAPHFITFRDALKQRHIEPTRQGLADALQNPDWQIRYLSALVLAENGQRDAIDEIRQALKEEKVPEARGNIALALAQLGDEEGLETLRGTCADSSAPARLRIYAAKYMLDLHHDDCLTFVTDLIRSSTDPAVRVIALSLVPRFQNVSPAELERLSSSAVGALSDQHPEVRSAASLALGLLGDASVIPALKSAIGSEKEEPIRTEMLRDLGLLQPKASH
jgi:HEAT repeat protein